MSEPVQPGPLRVTVEEVLPATGIAWVVDEGQRSWALTRSTPGTGIDALQPGQQLQAEVSRVEGGTYISRYRQMG